MHVFTTCPYQNIQNLAAHVDRVFVGLHIPIGSMYGIFTYIWLIFMVNVAKDTYSW